MNVHKLTVRKLVKKYKWQAVWKKRLPYGRYGQAELFSHSPIEMSEKLFDFPEICAAHCYLHELAHKLTNEGHTKAFYTKFSLLLMENKIFGIRFDRCGYYEEYKSKIAACEAK